MTFNKKTQTFESFSVVEEKNVIRKRNRDKTQYFNCIDKKIMTQ